MKFKTLIICILYLLISYLSIYAGEFRKINPIPTPAQSLKGAKPVAKIKEIDPQKVISSAKKIFSSWNKGNLEKYLSSDFYNKSRLLDSLTEPDKVPRDAKIRILSIGSIQTLNQYERETSNGKEIISTVSVTATSQIEFNDPVKGFRKLEGTNEYILRIIEREE